MSLDAALASIPAGLRTPLLTQFGEMLSEYRAGRWEVVGLKAGKLCEIIYSIVHGQLSGKFPATPFKPANMPHACQQLENQYPTAPRSLRIQIPRLLIAVYELRNNRAIGHVGGDVDPNHMDAELFVRSAKWLVAELVRAFANLSVTESNALVESLTEQLIPAVWDVGGFKRVMNPSLPAKDKALILCYSTPGGVKSSELCKWVGYKNITDFRSKVIDALHKATMLHFDRASDLVTISPAGIKRIETSGILNV
jgi:hypothetical protein